MILEINIPEKTAFFKQRVELDGVNYLLDFSYNEREDSFYLTLQDEDGLHLQGPMKILTNWPMLRWHRYEKRLPPGELLAIATQSTDIHGIAHKTPIPSAPGYGVLGKEIGFYYFDEEETRTPEAFSIGELDAASDPGTSDPEGPD